MYSGLLNYCLREATSALRQNKLACRTPLMQMHDARAIRRSMYAIIAV